MNRSLALLVTSAFKRVAAISRIAVLLSLAVAGLFLSACESPDERAAGYLESAKVLYDADDLVKAEIDVKNALQIQPKNSRARFLLAEINEQRREYQDMASNLRAALEENPDFPEARIKLAKLYAMSGALELAEEQTALLSDSDRELAEAKILQARIVAAKGDLEAAAVYLEEALLLEPANIEALGLLASVSATTDLDGALALIEQGIANADDARPLRMLRIQLLQQSGSRAADVEAEYRSLMNDYPDEIAFGYQLARFLATEGRVDEVEPVLLQIIKNDPENVEARLALTQFVANTRGPEEAEKLLRQFADEVPEAHELRLTLARLYQQTGRNDEASAQYELVARDAGNEDAGLTATARLAGIRLAAGDTDEGAELLEQVLAVDSVNADALLLRGALYIDQEKYRAAVSDLRSLLRANPENTRAQLLIARAHDQAGDPVLAEDAYRRTLEIDQGNAAATMQLARILVAQDELEDAEEILRDRLVLVPNDVRISRALIAVLLAQDSPEQAELEAKRIAELPEQSAVGNFLLGGIYQASGSHDRAVEAFKLSLQEKPTAREPLRGLVASLIKLERTDEAILHLEKLRDDYPDNLYAKTLLGQVLAGSGDASAAAKIFESTLQSDEAWLPAYTALAGLQSGDIASQINTYKRGLDAVPGSQELVLLLGTAYERNGEVEEAIASYENALRENPELPAVANNLSALLADYRTDKRSFERALEYAEQFRESDNPAFLDTLGWVYYRLENYEEAIPLLEQSVDAAGQVPVLRYHLGMAYIAAGKSELAKAQLEIALSGEAVEFTGVENARDALSKL